MHAPRAGVDQLRQRVDVGALELGELAVLDDQTRQLVLRRKLFEHVYGGRDSPGLGLASDLEIKLLENLPELNRRVDVELLTGKLVNLRREPRQLFLHLAPGLVERCRVHADPYALHLEKYLDQRQLDLRVDLLKLGGFDLRAKHVGDVKRQVRGL